MDIVILANIISSNSILLRLKYPILIKKTDSYKLLYFSADNSWYMYPFETQTDRTNRISFFVRENNNKSTISKRAKLFIFWQPTFVFTFMLMLHERGQLDAKHRNRGYIQIRRVDCDFFQLVSKRTSLSRSKYRAYYNIMAPLISNRANLHVNLKKLWSGEILGLLNIILWLRGVIVTLVKPRIIFCISSQCSFWYHDSQRSYTIN